MEEQEYCPIFLGIMHNKELKWENNNIFVKTITYSTQDKHYHI